VFSLAAHTDAGRSLAALASDLQAHGLSCLEIAGLNVGDEEQTLRELEPIVAASDALGAAFVNVRVVSPLDAPGLHDLLGRCEERISATGARLGFEFSRGSSLHGIEQTRLLIEKLGLHHSAVLVDTWHFFKAGGAWQELDALPAALLAYVQLSDGVPAEGDDHGQETLHRRQLPGEGDFPLSEFFERVSSKGVEVLVSVEVLNEEMRSLPAAEFCRRCYQSSLSVLPG
jgi:sugar phosphate isomerase/epimerase